MTAHDDKADLVRYLDQLREAWLWKLEGVDDPTESFVVQRRTDAESVTDAHLHDRAIVSRMSAVSATIDRNGEWSVSSTMVVVQRSAISF